VVPLELCKVIPGQLYKKKLPEELIRDMVRASVVKPQDRRGMIEQEVDAFLSFMFLMMY